MQYQLSDQICAATIYMSDIYISKHLLRLLFHSCMTAILLFNFFAQMALLTFELMVNDKPNLHFVYIISLCIAFSLDMNDTKKLS